jgi:rhodanese-related sulfurtransferase
MHKKTMRSLLLFLAFSLLPFACGSVFAQEFKIPRISIDELKALLDKGTEVVILDTQPKKLYQKGHIKGAISFPFKMKLDGSEVLELPREKLIVLYCDCGPGESDSNHMGVQLKELGFSDVKVLAAPSIKGWKQNNYPIEK